MRGGQDTVISEGEKGKERSVYNKGGSTVGLRIYVAEGGQKEAQMK